MQLDKDKKYLGAVPREHFVLNRNKKNINGNYVDNSPDQKLVEQISSGFKVLVLMRGAPGSGKTTLANQLLQRCVPLGNIYQPEHFIFSTDNYFYDSLGRYRFNVMELDKAHANNQRRVREKALAGWSPIIVDNTNMQLWEMMVYVEVAVRCGYLIEILEPTTSWCRSATKLALRNQHNVPAEKIKMMLNKYEAGTVADLLKMLKTTKYTVPLPQIRKHPPIMITSSDIETDEKFQINQTTNVPIQHVYDGGATDAHVECTQITPTIEYNSNTWKSLGDGFGESVDVELNADVNKPTLLDLLKEGITDVQIDENINNHSTSAKPRLQRHKTDCRNENSIFASLRQMYPNKKVNELWDLFEKCNGDADWAVDILLKEDELSSPNEEKSYAEAIADNFDCNCDLVCLEEPPEPKFCEPLIPPELYAKPQRQRYRRNHTTLDIDFKFNDMRGANDMRRYGATETNPLKNSKEAAVQTDFCDDDQEPDNNDFIEVSFGKDLIGKLMDSFNIEIKSSLGEVIPENINTNVFLPRSLAKELYMLWVESSYNQMEEQRQKTLREDEDFARLLKIPKYENFKQSPNNVQELLDFELALKLSNEKEPETAAIDALGIQPINLAEHLTQMKLCEDFPDIPRNTLLDILASKGNSFLETVEMLRSFDPNDNSKEETPPITNENLKKDSPSTTTLKITPEEAKRLALLEFEEMRNMAAHHCQLKAECYQKSKEAIQKGNSTVALYYSQVANCHKEKIDMYNHRAANSIVEVHRRTQNNPDLLDLHYLHVIEAIICLDLFLDDHITTLRHASRMYKHIFIITGRGLHSVGGVSSIKNKVKTRLKERNLRWSEVNPGLLKVKIFSASRHSKNI